ncbi:hypothetical protein LTR94_030984, partial [Friedmanniomyces endolithicus]
NRVLIAVGAGVGVSAAVVLARIFTGGGEKRAEAPPASKGGLVVDLAEAPSLEPTRELRCFVNGQFVGMATLADCAQRNGLATDALDVGIDETGALAAAPTAAFAPPPELPAVEVAPEGPNLELQPATPTTPSAPPAAVGAQCMRHTGSDWRVLSSGLSLNACVQALYAGVCVRPGDAQYGRWGDTTLRLVPRRVEQSPDN